MVALKSSTCTVACEWFLVVVTVLMQSSLQSAVKNLENKKGTVSVSTIEGILKLATQCPINIFAIIVAVVFVVWIASVQSSVYLLK